MLSLSQFPHNVLILLPEHLRVNTYKKRMHIFFYNLPPYYTNYTVILVIGVCKVSFIIVNFILTVSFSGDFA